MTEEDKKTAEEMLQDVAYSQAVFWKDVSQLEHVLGFEIDDGQDLMEVTVDDLLKQQEECPHGAV